MKRFQMNGSLLAMLVVLSAGTALPSSADATPTQARNGARQQNGTTLYQAKFKENGLKGWETRGGHWHVNRDGTVSFADLLPGEILAPFRTSNVQYFAVQARIKDLGPVQKGVRGSYGVVARDTGQERSGIMGGFAPGSLGFFRARDTGPGVLAWGNDNVGGIHPARRSGYTTYRLEVRGTDYALFVDGQKIVAFTIADYRAGTRVGISSAGEKLQVSSFTVTQLQPAAPLPTLPPVKAMNLGPTDVPNSFTEPSGYYYTPEEEDYLLSVHPGPSLPGFIIQYAADYGTNLSRPTSAPLSLLSSVAGFPSAQAAQQSLATYWTARQKQRSGSLNYAAGDLTGVGDAAHELRYDQPVSSDTWSWVGIYFCRGSYVVLVQEAFFQGKVPQKDMVKQTTALAKIVDGRIQTAGSSS